VFITNQENSVLSQKHLSPPSHVQWDVHNVYHLLSRFLEFTRWKLFWAFDGLRSFFFLLCEGNYHFWGTLAGQWSLRCEFSDAADWKSIHLAGMWWLVKALSEMMLGATLWFWFFIWKIHKLTYHSGCDFLITVGKLVICWCVWYLLDVRDSCSLHALSTLVKIMCLHCFFGVRCFAFLPLLFWRVFFIACLF